tara:strand:- start:228 stop:347 length:120 start_codon:yes stop_codon:yes gene_type:complete
VRKKAPFKLNCFGVLGIILLMGGVLSTFVLYYSMVGILK